VVLGKKKEKELTEEDILEGLSEVNRNIVEDLQKKNEIIRGLQLQVSDLTKRTEKIERALWKDEGDQ
jgi:hypothetical protein